MNVTGWPTFCFCSLHVLYVIAEGISISWSCLRQYPSFNYMSHCWHQKTHLLYTAPPLHKSKHST